MQTNGTIAAISSALGGGIGVIRVSGPDAISIADKLFRSASGEKLTEIAGYTAKYGYFVDNKEKIDEIIALIFRNPHSYTGENIVEFYCHGGIYITRRILQAVLDSGARAADPGEFTKRAFLNGKIDLVQAESVMDIIAAQGEQAARIALSNKEGAITKKVEKIKDKIVNLAASLAVWADYPEEDIEESSADEVVRGLKNLESNLKKLVTDYNSGKIVREGVDVAIVGAPNSGKSTLMNVLTKQNRSIVSEIAGTTRDIIEEQVLFGGLTVRLSDTAGVRGDTSDEVERIGIEKTKAKIKQADLILAVFDYSRELSQQEIGFIELIKDVKVIAIVNKSDLKGKIDLEYLKDIFEKVVLLSAKDVASGKNDDLMELEKSVLQLVDARNFSPGEAVLATQRQYQAAKMAMLHLREARKAIEDGVTLDAVTVLVESALEEMLSITGKCVTEEIIDEIFSKFCVGK